MYFAYRKNFRAQMGELRSSVDNIITENINTDMGRISAQIMDSVAPYSRFVRQEKASVSSLRKDLADIRGSIRRIQDMTGKVDEV